MTTSLRPFALLAAAAFLGACATSPTTPPAAASAPAAAPVAAADADDADENLVTRASFFTQHIRLGELEEAKKELDAGYPVDAVDGLGQTALIAAAEKDQVVGAALLIRYKAQVDRKDSAGWTALIHAVYFGASPELVDLLLDHGANVNAQNDRGITALYLAAGTGKADVVKHLLARGADPSIASTNGYTPLRIAQLKGWTPIVALLDPAAAKTSSATPSKVPATATR